MTKRRTTHWADIGESTFVAGLLLLYGIHRLLGRWPFRLVLYPVVFWYWATRPWARRASLDYLKRLQAAHHVFGRTPGWRHSLRHFLAFADSLTDKLMALSSHYPFKALRFAGRESVLAMIERGQGGIFITAHMGCLELCRAAIGHHHAEQQKSFRLTILVHTAHAEQFNRVLKRLEGDSAHSHVTLMQVRDISPATAMLLADKVAQGEFIAIAGDRVPVASAKTARAPFLGSDARWPVGPYVLAALLKCPLYLMACTRVENTYELRYEQIAGQVELPRARRDQALAELAARYAQGLEAIAARSPYDWFNFYPFWEQA